jgi:geranylgeranyl reductase
VVGGGPAGATAATELARRGHKVALLDRAGRIKPCGGAIPPRLIQEYNIPDEQLVARINCARMTSPKGKHVDIHIKGGFVGMVDREDFDEYLRNRAALCGAKRITGRYEKLDRNDDGTVNVTYTRQDDSGENRLDVIRAKAVIGADGALSRVGKSVVPGAEKLKYVFAYHEIVKSPEVEDENYGEQRCEVIYNGGYSPDFYSWVFPHGKTASIGTGTAHKGFSLRGSIADFREANGLDKLETIRTEGAPIPLEPLPRWDDGRNVLLAGDAAGVVAPASGEGIYYAMTGGRIAGETVDRFLATGDAKVLADARRQFLKHHGNVFKVLDMMQRYWYTNDDRRERFVKICRDKDVQELTFDAYMNKELVKARPLAHVRIFFKNIAHLMGLVPA